jgi:hypothetical protein
VTQAQTRTPFGFGFVTRMVYGVWRSLTLTIDKQTPNMQRRQKQQATRFFFGFRVVFSVTVTKDKAES